MTWTKLSDDYTDDCWTLSDPAFRLHTEALVWNNRKLLDLKIPKDEVRRFAKDPSAVQELLDTGFWTDLGAAYIIRHHATYQRSREAVIRQQEANKANRAKRGQATPATREIAPQADPTPSSNESLHDSLHERDRTGQAGTTEDLSSLENELSEDLGDLEAQMVDEQAIESENKISADPEPEQSPSAGDDFDWYGHLGKQGVS